MFDHIPVGVGSKGIIPMNARDLEEALEMGMDWSLREGKRKKCVRKSSDTMVQNAQILNTFRLYLG